jgi:plasmid stabilization system protein ParE
MTFNVETTVEADQDAETILEWLLSQHAGETGTKWLAALKEAIESLSKFPERRPLAPESPKFPFQVRQLFYGHSPHIYRILFTINQDRVYVLYIRHGRRHSVTQ